MLMGDTTRNASSLLNDVTEKEEETLSSPPVTVRSPFEVATIPLPFFFDDDEEEEED